MFPNCPNHYEGWSARRHIPGVLQTAWGGHFSVGRLRMQTGKWSSKEILSLEPRRVSPVCPGAVLRSKCVPSAAVPRQPGVPQVTFLASGRLHGLWSWEDPGKESAWNDNRCKSKLKSHRAQEFHEGLAMMKVKQKLTWGSDWRGWWQFICQSEKGCPNHKMRKWQYS